MAETFAFGHVCGKTVLHTVTHVRMQSNTKTSAHGASAWCVCVAFYHGTEEGATMIYDSRGMCEAGSVQQAGYVS
jgi:hypothetical protein